MENLFEDKIGKQLKDLLKTKNEWIPQYNNRILPPFIMGKEKHNNKTGVNVFGSDTITYKSFGRKKNVPLVYFCEFETENDGHELQMNIHYKFHKKTGNRVKRAPSPPRKRDATSCQMSNGAGYPASWIT